jgi:hypothetical protein
MELGLFNLLASIPPIALIIIIVFLITFIMIIIINTVKTIRSFQHADDLITQIDKINDIKFNSSLLKYENWINENQFVQDCFIQTKVSQTAAKDAVVTVPDNDISIKSAVWWSEKDKTRLNIASTPSGIVIILNTSYPDETVIATGSSKNLLMFPQKDNLFFQVFTNLSIDNLYMKHLEARNLIETDMNISPSGRITDLVTKTKEALKDHAEFLTSLPFWYFRGIYWFFIRRNFLVNKPIKINNP